MGRKRQEQAAQSGFNVIVHNTNAHGSQLAPSFNPALAAIFSFLIPGLGQVYRGKVLRGIAWFLATVAGYTLIIPGLILHLLCVITAATGSRRR